MKISTNDRPLFVSASCLLLMALACGCSTTTHYTAFKKVSSDPTSAQSENVLISTSELNADEYEVLGKVYSLRKGGLGGRRSEKALRGDITELAKDVGADAVVGFRWVSGYGKTAKGSGFSWASGLAARTITAPVHGDAAIERLPFVVAIPTVTPKAFPDWQAVEKARLEAAAEKKAKRTHGGAARKEVDASGYSAEAYKEYCQGIAERGIIAEEMAQYHVELKGYYASIVGHSMERIDVNTLEAMDQEELDDLFGPLAENILIVDVIGLKQSNIGIAASAQCTFNAALFSRTRRAVIWEGKGYGGTASAGLVLVLAEGSEWRLLKSFEEGMEKTFKTLPRAPSKVEGGSAGKD